MTRKLTEFYNGKIIFLTGASGYLGIILLEILLRCFPGIKRIYILLRPKKNFNIEMRKKQIMESMVMKHIRDNCPEVLEKVQIVAGELGKVNFGMNKEDLQKLISEVQIVFHLAATVSFTSTYRDTAIQNCKGTFYALDFCKKVENLEAVIYTGTAYSNVHVVPEKADEKIYELPYPARRFLDELDNGTEESFDKLIESMDFKWPNAYIFSKRLAENVLKEFSGGIPLAIVRPSVIIQPWKGPNKGYFIDGLGIQKFTYAVTRGIIRVVSVVDNNCLDMIPADVVANSHIIAAWGLATGRLPQLHIINCVAGDSSLRTTFKSFVKDIAELAQKNQPIPNGFQEASATCVENNTLWLILRFYEEYLPCLIFDLCLRLYGKKPKFVKIQKLYFALFVICGHFLRFNLEFHTENFQALAKLLDPEEREIIYTEIKGITVRELFELSTQVSTLYVSKFDTLSPKKRRYIIFRNTILTTFIRRFTLIILIYIIYFIVSILFFK